MVQATVRLSSERTVCLNDWVKIVLTREKQQKGKEKRFSMRAVGEGHRYPTISSAVVAVTLSHIQRADLLC